MCKYTDIRIYIYTYTYIWIDIWTIDAYICNLCVNHMLSVSMLH